MPDWLTDLKALREALAKTRQRRLLVLAGEPDWTAARLAEVMELWSARTVLTLGGEADEGSGIASQRSFRQYLGREYDLVVLDVTAGLDVDALAAIAGSLHGGGLMIMRVPPLAQWPAQPDAELARFVEAACMRGTESRFIRRLIACMRETPAVSLLEQNGAYQPCEIPVAFPQDGHAGDSHRPTDSQQAVIAAIEEQVAAVTPVPVVVIANRGRGKSAALGMAIAGLTAEQASRAVITAPRQAACRIAIEHAERGASGNENALRYIPPDELIRAQPAADLLLIDEAAAIPLPMLEQLVRRYPRVVMTSTLYGYEGTGRGFGLKFFPLLDRLVPGWRLLEMQAPIRWARDDPLEAWLATALLLDADLPSLPAAAEIETDALCWAAIERDALLEDPTLLRQIFGVLVSAHYRTRPSDLRQMLDAPDVSIYALTYRARIVAAALVIMEGPIAPELSAAILTGRRRARGQLIPQSLIAYGGWEAAGQLVCARVMRIAVHPECQGRGVGSQLLAGIETRAARAGADWMGASFGATRALLRFWMRRDYVAVRLGLKREASSGAHSVVVLKPYSQRARALLPAIRERFAQLLQLQQHAGVLELEPRLYAQLLARGTDTVPDTAVILCAGLLDQDWRELVAFAFGHRGYEVSLLALQRWYVHYREPLAELVTLSDQERRLLARKLEAHLDWSALAAELHFHGRQAVQRAFRQTLQYALWVLARPRVEPELARLGLGEQGTTDAASVPGLGKRE